MNSIQQNSTDRTYQDRIAKYALPLLAQLLKDPSLSVEEAVQSAIHAARVFDIAIRHFKLTPKEPNQP